MNNCAKTFWQPKNRKSNSQYPGICGYSFEWSWDYHPTNQTCEELLSGIKFNWKLILQWIRNKKQTGNENRSTDALWNTCSYKCYWLASKQTISDLAKTQMRQTGSVEYSAKNRLIPRKLKVTIEKQDNNNSNVESNVITQLGNENQTPSMFYIGCHIILNRILYLDWSHS